MTSTQLCVTVAVAIILIVIFAWWLWQRDKKKKVEGLIAGNSLTVPYPNLPGCEQYNFFEKKCLSRATSLDGNAVDFCAEAAKAKSACFVTPAQAAKEMIAVRAAQAARQRFYAAQESCRKRQSPVYRAQFDCVSMCPKPEMPGRDKCIASCRAKNSVAFEKVREARKCGDLPGYANEAQTACYQQCGGL